MVKCAGFATKNVSKTVGCGHAFQQALTAIRFNHFGRVFQQVTVEVAHHQHIWFALCFERGHKVFQRVGLLCAPGVKAALTGINVARSRAAALAFKVIDDKPEVAAVRPIHAAGKALCQRRAASYCGVAGQVCASGQHNAAYAVNLGGLVQNVDLDGVSANGSAVDCGVSARARFGVECFDQLKRGQVRVLNFS